MATPRIPKLLKNKEKSSEWLVQPTAITFMRYNYTLIQSKIFVQIIRVLQGAIQEAIYNSNHHIQASPSIFELEEFNIGSDPNSITFKMPLSCFGTSKGQYKDLKDGLRALVSVPIAIPFKDEEGRSWMKYSGLCTVVIPEDVAKVTHVYIEIKRDVALHLLNVDFGFTRFLEKVIMSAKLSYTPRIYLYLSQSLYNGGCEISYDEFRKYLRLGKKYPKFTQVAQRILNPTKEELLEKFNQGISNFYFEWEPSYEPGCRIPSKIIFKTISKEMQKLNDEQLNKQKRYIYDLLRSQTIMMDEKYALEIVDKVTADNFMLLLEKIQELAELMNRKDWQVTNRGGYTYTSLVNYLEEMSSRNSDGSQTAGK